MKAPLARSTATGELVAVDSVDRGLAAGVVCVDCGEPMVAKQGDIVQWHFAHTADSDCGGEGWAHMYAKSVFAECGVVGLSLLDPQHKFKVSWAKEEQPIDFQGVNRRVDVALRGFVYHERTRFPASGTMRLVAEVKSSNAKDADFRADMAKINLAAVEFDVGAVMRKADEDGLSPLDTMTLIRKRIIVGAKSTQLHWLNVSTEFVPFAAKQLRRPCTKCRKVDVDPPRRICAECRKPKPRICPSCRMAEVPPRCRICPDCRDAREAERYEQWIEDGCPGYDG